MALSLRYGAVSDVGRSRKKNDDSGYAGPHFLMVADGMGGAPAGDLASAVAVQNMQRLDEPPADDLLETLAGALQRANDRLAELLEEDPTVAGMGTTVTAALFDGHRIGVCHLGDSRGYLWRGGELLRMTHDHTWVQNLIDEGRLTEEEAKTHSHRSLILKVLDGRHDNAPDLALYELEAGDRILLCSDGLSGFVEHDRIERVLAIGTAQSVAEELTQLALEAGSTDNITVVVADVADEPVVEDALVVGAAANPPRRPRSRLRAWAQRDDTDVGENLLDPDIEELRYAPREPKRFLWLRRALILGVGLALIAVLGVYSYRWTQRQYYVAAANDKVAIYQGVQPDLPGLSLHRVYATQDLLLSELPSYQRTQVIDGLNADNIEDAQRITEGLLALADGCAAQATVDSSPKTASASAPRLVGGPTTRPADRPTTPPADRPTTRPPQKSSATPSTTTPETGPPETDADTGDLSPKECSGATPRPEATR